MARRPQAAVAVVAAVVDRAARRTLPRPLSRSLQEPPTTSASAPVVLADRAALAGLLEPREMTVHRDRLVTPRECGKRALALSSSFSNRPSTRVLEVPMAASLVRLVPKAARALGGWAVRLVLGHSRIITRRGPFPQWQGREPVAWRAAQVAIRALQVPTPLCLTLRRSLALRAIQPIQAVPVNRAAWPQERKVEVAQVEQAVAQQGVTSGFRRTTDRYRQTLVGMGVGVARAPQEGILPCRVR